MRVNGSEQSVTINKGEVVGACIDKHDGLDIVSDIAGHSLAMKHIRGGCSDIEDVTVRNTMGDLRESMRLHLYAVIGKHNKM